MIMMIMMMYMLVDVSSAGRGRHRILREFTLEPTHDLCHRSSLILFARGVLQLMLLARSTALLRMNELCVVSLQVAVIVGNRLMISRLLVIVGHEIDDVPVSVATAGGVLRRVVVDRRRRNHVTIQYLRIRRIGLGRGMCRVVLRCRVSRFSEIRRSRFNRRFRKRHGMMSVLPDWFMIVPGRLTRFQRRRTVLIIMIRGF